jgi:DNA-binding transcriptional regulator YdaS (Cro superfamily)
MQTLLHTEFAALPDRADVRQVAFARLTGVTARQVNNWCRGRATVPRWAAIVAVMLGESSEDALAIKLEETTSSGTKRSACHPMQRPAPFGALRRRKNSATVSTLTAKN